jgi:2-phospho-L-lactate guanylyltransferase
VTRTVAVVPLRDGTSGKTRLAAVLGPQDRARLVVALARHVVATLVGVPGVEAVLVVSADPESARTAMTGLVGPVHVLGQPPDRPGLDAALDVGRDAVVRAGSAERLLVVHADLPALAADDVAALLAAPPPVVLAPDRAGTGTNALALEPADAPFTFRFGPGSRAAHLAEARARGHSVTEVVRPGTATDLDTPADWAALDDAVRRRVRAAVPATAGMSGTADGRSGPPG